MKPWEKYAQPAEAAPPTAAAPPADGPWSKYASASQAPAMDPTGSALQNYAAGIGSKFADLGLGIKQRLAESIQGSATGAGVDALLQLAGRQSADDRVKAIQQEVADKRKLDAPLLKTTGGKLGAITGAAVPAVVAGMVPGGQGLAGSMATGAILGAAEPTTEDESVARNVTIGAGGGAAGYGVGKLINAGVQKVVASRAATQAANAGRDAAGAESRAAGFVIPPSQTNPSLLNRTLEGFSGKLTTAQNASAKNQAVFNSKAAEAIGLPAETKLSPEVLDSVRAEAGQAYKAVSELGNFDATRASLPASVKVVENNSPLMAGKTKAVDAGEVVRAWRQANADATAYYRAFARDANPETLAKAKAAAGDAKQIDDFLVNRVQDAQKNAPVKLIEDLAAGRVDQEEFLKQALGLAQKSDMVEALKAARVRIAKTYSVENAMNAATGSIDGRKLAKQLQAGKPLSGELKDAAEFAGRFPKASQPVEGMGSLPQSSPLDWAAAGSLSALTSNPLMMASVLARPAARNLILSPSYQASMGAANYTPTIAELLGKPATKEALRIGALVSPQLLQQK